MAHMIRTGLFAMAAVARRADFRCKRFLIQEVVRENARRAIDAYLDNER